MADRLPTLAVVGRVNVGKSSLFNKICGGRGAIVDNAPGVTRDRKFAVAQWGGRSFVLVDTGGLSPGKDDPFQEAIRRQVAFAVDEADAVVFLVDAATGIHPHDQEAAMLIRKSGLPVILAVNKVDTAARLDLVHEFNALGLGKPWPVSAAHGLGVADLLDHVLPFLPEMEIPEFVGVSIAIIGRPNVGKSSLVNRLCDAERAIVNPEPGTTRDSTDTIVKWKETSFRLIDTAGLRRKCRKMEDVEFYSTLRAWRSAEGADVCVVVLDGAEYPAGQDARILNRVWEMGKGVLICVNKVDLNIDRKLWIESVIQRFPPAAEIPVMFVSALTGTGVGRILPEVNIIAERRAMKLSTSKVNQLLLKVVREVPPPSPGGKQLKFFYATQVRQAPPSFLLFVTRPDLVPENYRRYLENSFRRELKLKGVPMNLVLRKRDH
jgi:GTP-binding protein